MRTFTMENGERFEVRDARSLIRKLRADSPYPEASQKAWMKGVARRTYQTTKTRVSTDNENAFVAALICSGKIKEIEP